MSGLSFTEFLGKLNLLLFVMRIKKIRNLAVAATVIVLPQAIFLLCILNKGVSEAIYCTVMSIVNEFNNLK